MMRLLNCWIFAFAVVFSCSNHIPRESTFPDLSHARWSQTLFFKNSAVSAFAFDGTDYYAATRENGVFVSHDRGKNWHRLPCDGLPAGAWIRSMIFHEQALFVGVYRNGVFRSRDSGATWEAINNGLGNTYVNALVETGSVLWAGTDDGVFGLDNAGSQWTATSEGLTDTKITGLAARDSVLFVLAFSGAIFRSVPSGVSWVRVDTGIHAERRGPVLSVSALAASDSGVFAAVGAQVFRSTDNGVTWRMQINDTRYGAAVSLMAAEGQKLCARTHDEFLITRGFSYSNWNARRLAVTSLAMDNNQSFAGLEDGVLVLQVDSAYTQQEWKKTQNGLTAVRAFPVAALKGLVFANTDGGVFRSVDSGATWHLLDAPLLSRRFTAMAAIDNELFSGTGFGVARSVDRGITWTLVSTGLPDSFGVSHLTVLGTTLFAACPGHGIYRSNDRGATWKAIHFGLTNKDVYAIAACGNTLFAVASNDTVSGMPLLFRSDNKGTWWRNVAVPVPEQAFFEAFAVNGKGLFLATRKGILRSYDKGATWLLPDSGINGALVRSLTVTGSQLFAMTDSGIFRSPDNGIHWERNPTGTSISPGWWDGSLAVCGPWLIAGTSNAGVWRLRIDKAESAPVRQEPPVVTSGANLVDGTAVNVRKSDSLALLAIKKNVTSDFYRRGGDSKDPWDTTKTLDTWTGVSLQNDRVHALYLARSGLRQLPPEIGDLTGLVMLDVSNNSLSALPPEIGNCTLIEELNLSHQSAQKEGGRLASLPPEIGKLVNLRKLNCSSCGIESLPAEIGKCAALTELLIDRNSLDVLPEEIGNLTNLTCLELWSNQLRSLPAAIGNLSTLVRLNCGANQLSRIPPEIGNLKNLRTLDLSCNYANLTTIPDAFFRLAELTFLNLSNNSLTTVPQGIRALRQLTMLNLRENRLSTLPEGIAVLKKLDTLLIASNEIEEIDLPAPVVTVLNRLDPGWRKAQLQSLETFKKGLGMVPDTVSDSIRSRIVTIVPVSSDPHYYPEDEYETEGPPEGRYFALCARDSTYRLDTVWLAAKRSDSIVSFYNGMVKGRIVTTRYRPEMRLLLRGIPGLSPGPLKTWYCSPLWQYSDKVRSRYYPLRKKYFSQDMSLDSIGTFSMKADQPPDDNSNGSIQWRVRFGSGPWWTLPVVPGQTSQDPSWAPAKLAILWIGDLDSDGEPDMIMRPILDFDGVIQLFLSSQRRPDHLWRSAATFYHYPPGAGD